MKCTSCKSGNLIPSFLNAQFRCHTCDRCGGNWILIEDYVSWRERNPGFEFNPACVDEVDPEDTKDALLCPVTGGLMRKFRISKDIPHRIDYSARVGGVWLDKGEWELLVSEGLAGSLNAVLTDQWQERVKLDSSRAALAQMYRNKFGDEDYEKAQELRDWINTNKNSEELRRFILLDPERA